MEPLIIRVAPGGSEPVVDTPEPLLEAIAELHEDGRCDEAIPRYEKFLEDFPESGHFGEAVVRLGMCHEAREEWERARGYHRWAAEHAHFDLAFEAALRAAWCLEQMGEPARAAAEYAALAGVDRAPEEARAGARLRQSIMLFRVGRAKKAAKVLEQGIVAYSAVPDPGPATRSAAAEARFAAAEQKARAFSGIKLEYPQKTLDKRVRKKLDALVAARGAYQQVVQIKDAEWAAVAVTREGELFEELHDALLAVPPPSSFDDAQRSLYANEVRSKSRPLLQQAFDSYVQVSALGERVGLDSAWVAKARSRMQALEPELHQRILSPDEQDEEGEEGEEPEEGAPDDPDPD